MLRRREVGQSSPHAQGRDYAISTVTPANAGVYEWSSPPLTWGHACAGTMTGSKEI